MTLYQLWRWTLEPFINWSNISRPTSPPSSSPEPDAIGYFEEGGHMIDGARAKSLSELTYEALHGKSASSVAIVDKILLESQEAEDRDLVELFTFYRHYPAESVCTIASSNVFVHTPDVCIPAEIGLVHFSLNDGVMGELHSLVRCNQVISTNAFRKHHANALATYHHDIDHNNRQNPPTEILTQRVHHFIYPSTGPHQGTAWIFVAYDEYEQTRDVMYWFRGCEELAWSMKIIRLSSVLKYLKRYYHHQYQQYGEAFKTRDLLFTCLCRYHRESSPQCPNCARSKAHIYGYAMSRAFTPIFVQSVPPLQLINGCHYPWNKHFQRH